MKNTEHNMAKQKANAKWTEGKVAWLGLTS